MEIRELKSKSEMMKHIALLQEMYPNLSLEDYSKDLDDMIPNNYFQVAVFENGKCLGLSGVWFGTKLWCGKYIELDNIIVSNKFRSKGVGKYIFDYVQNLGKEMGVSMLSLDSYVTNHKAHKFFYNEGFGPKGFHFIKILEEDKIR